MREIILDTETTGLDPDSGHRIIEIGCVELVNGYRTGRVFHQYLNPKRAVPKDAQAIHGITDQFLKDKPYFETIVDEFLHFIDSARLVIHNASFDLKFLNAELARLKRQPLAFEVIDTLLVARKKFPGAKANLDALCQRYKIDRSHRDKHGALLDAELLSEVYLMLSGRGSSLLYVDEMRSQTVRLGNSSMSIEVQQKPLQPARPHAASKEELAAHEAFLEKIKEPVWKKISG